MAIHQLIYVSRPVAASARQRLGDIRSILDSSRRNNLRDGITGFLLCEAKSFVQILEGEEGTVVATYNRIANDRRHLEPVILAKREMGRRTFPEWSMGNVIRSLEHQEIFLRNGVSGPLDPGRLTAPAILALAMDLQDHELAQRRMVKVAS